MKPMLTLVHDKEDDVGVENGGAVIRRPQGIRGKVSTPSPAKPLPIEPYHQLTDVPVPLRHTIRRAHESGLTIENLVKIFDLPVEWVQRFVADPGLD